MRAVAAGSCAVMSAAALVDPALFRCVPDALRFAFNFKHGQCELSAMARLMDGDSRAGRGLAGLDGAGNAGFVWSEVDALEPRIRGHILVARYAARALPCDCGHACCSNWRPNADWLLAIAEIAETLRTEALSDCVVNFTLRHIIVRRYFGVRQSLVDAASAAGVERHTAGRHADKAIGYLREEERKARYAIEGRLKEAGIVE